MPPKPIHFLIYEYPTFLSCVVVRQASLVENSATVCRQEIAESSWFLCVPGRGRGKRLDVFRIIV